MWVKMEVFKITKLCPEGTIKEVESVGHVYVTGNPPKEEENKIAAKHGGDFLCSPSSKDKHGYVFSPIPPKDWPSEEYVP